MNKKHVLILISVLLAAGMLGGLRFCHHKVKKLVRRPHREVPAAVAAPLPTTKGIVLAGNFVDVTTERAGFIEAIHFVPGQLVEKDAVLIELSNYSDVLQLEGLKLEEAIDKKAYERSVAQIKSNAISRSALELATAELKKKQLEIKQQEFVLAQKHVRAPFKGRTDFSSLCIGQFIAPGSKIVRIYALEPVYVDFLLPEEMLPVLKLNIPIEFRTKIYPKLVFSGTVTAINSVVDPDNHMIQLRATIINPGNMLLPGVSGDVIVKVKYK